MVIHDFIQDTSEFFNFHSIAEQIRRFVYTSEMFDDDMSFKCYVYCTWNELGAFLPNGKLDRVKLLKSIETLDAESQMIILNMGKRCLAQKERNLCDRIYVVLRCMKESDREHFFMLWVNGKLRNKGLWMSYCANLIVRQVYVGMV